VKRTTEEWWQEERVIADARYAVLLWQRGAGPDCPTERAMIKRIDELTRERDEAIRQRDRMLEESERLIRKHTAGGSA
jgi:hypothetical protein